MYSLRSPSRLPFALLLYITSCFISGELNARKKIYLAGFEIESDIGSVEAVAGQSASLPCNITPPIQDDNVTLVLWYKGESEKPIYSFDARIEITTGETNPEHFMHKNLNSRATFRSGSSPAILRISNVEEEDAGAYRCRVDFFKSRTVHYKVTLTITVPPRKPIIMDENGQSMKGLIGPFNEGSRLHLICEVEGGKPTPVVKWWRESNLISSKSEVGRGGVIRSDLFFHNLKTTDQAVKFTCEATNNNITQPPSTDIILDLNFKPKSVRIITSKEPLSAGRRQKIRCESKGSKPPAVMTWWKGSEKMKMTEEIVSEDKMTTTSVLMLTPSSGDSGKFLSCRADNPTIPGSAREDGWKLKIYYKPKLTLKVDEKQLRADSYIEGSDVYLLCSIIAEPWITNIRWMLNGKMLRSGKNTLFEVPTNDATLHLKELSLKDQGAYQCLAINEEGQGRSNLVNLKIKHKPVCKDGLKWEYIVSKMEAIRVICKVDANPPEVNFSWSFNRTTMKKDMVTLRDIESYTTTATSSVASFMPEDEWDYGILNCWARNKIGQMIEPCRFKLVFAGPPDPVKNCSVFNRTNDMLEVRCMPGNDGGLSQKFLVEVYDMTVQKSKLNLTSLTPSFVISGLDAGHTFTVIILAENDKGRSRAEEIFAKTSHHPLKRTGSGNSDKTMTSLLFIIIAVVIFAILASTLVCFLKRRNSRHSAATGTIKKSQSPEIQRTTNHMIGTTIDQDFQHYDVKGPDIIPARTSSKDAGFEHFTSEDRYIKRFNNISDVLYDNEFYEKDNKTKIACISSSPKTAAGELHYAELSLATSRSRPSSQLNTVQRPAILPTEYASIDFNQTIRNRQEDDVNRLSEGLMLKPPSGDDSIVTCETPLINYPQLESSV